MFFFQLPWLPEFIVRRRDWALLVRALQDTSTPGLFSDSDLERKGVVGKERRADSYA